MLRVSRAVVQVHPRLYPDGGRFPGEAPSKGQGVPTLQAQRAQITAKLEAHAVERGLGRDDLLFQAPEEEGAPRMRVPPVSRPRRPLAPH